MECSDRSFIARGRYEAGPSIRQSEVGSRDRWKEGRKEGRSEGGTLFFKVTDHPNRVLFCGELPKFVQPAAVQHKITCSFHNWWNVLSCYQYLNKSEMAFF